MAARDFFYMPKSDRQLTVALLAVAAAALAVVFLAGAGGSTPAPTSDEADSLTAGSPTAADTASALESQLFAFDPNTADSSQLSRLGLQPWLVKSICKYRQHGGVFQTKEDFARLYGLTVKQYRELEPYIRISPEYRPASTLFPRKSHPAHQATPLTHGAARPQPGAEEPATHASRPSKLHQGETIDLNTADTTLLQRVPGIGSYFSRRIADYRERLGGYVDKYQLLEINDFPEDALDYFHLDSTTPLRRVAINTMTADQLRRHPYISYFQARAIMDYRRLHGRIDNLDQLSLSRDFPQEAIDRLRPYVEY